MEDFDIDHIIGHALSDSHVLHSDLITDLTNAWTSERNSPELLPYNHTLLEGATSRLRDQISRMEETENINVKSNFQMVIVQTELERVKFLIRAYLRTRISKLDKTALFYARDTADQLKLSALEQQYNDKHLVLLQRHVKGTFMKDLPETGQLTKIDDPGAAGISMIDRPDLNKAVFAKVLHNISTTFRIGSDRVDLLAGNIVLVSYRYLKNFIYEVSTASWMPQFRN